MADEQPITATNPTNGKKVQWNGTSWIPYVEPPKAGDFTRGFSDTMGFSKPEISFGQMGSETIENLKRGASNEYERLKKMTGEEGKPLSQRGFSEALFIPGMIASGAEGLGGSIEKSLKDLFTPGKGKYAAGEMLASIGQFFMGEEGESATSEAAAAAKQGSESVLREALGVPERTVEKARSEHTTKMAELQLKNLQDHNSAIAEYDKALKEAEEEHQKAVNETEGTNLQKEAAHKIKVEQIKEKHAAQIAKDEANYKQKVSQLQREYEDQISAFNRPGEKTASGEAAASEVKRKSLLTQPRSGPVYQRIAGMADKVAETIPILSKKVRAAYDARWGAWREAMGDAEGNFTPVQQAVQEAEDNILKGSPENIAVFKNILREGEDPLLANASVFRGGAGVDVKDIIGSRYMSEATRNRVLRSLEDAGVSSETGRMPLEATTLPIDEIRGYLTELQQKMHTGKFTGDVYRALKHVQDAANKEIERVAGEKGQLSSYRKLKGDWSQFLGDFYDSDGALKKLQNAVNSDSRLNLLSGSEGSRIIEAMGRYSKFSPDIEGVGRLRSLMKQIRELPARGKAPVEPEIPGRPSPRPEPVLPAAPTPKPLPEFKAPTLKTKEPADIEPFNTPKFVKDAVTKRAEQLGIAGHTLIAYWIIRDIFHGEFPSPAMLGAPIVQAAIRRYLTSPRFLDKMTRMVQ